MSTTTKERLPYIPAFDSLRAWPSCSSYWGIPACRAFQAAALASICSTLAIAAALAWFSYNTVEKAGRLKAKAFRQGKGARHVPEAQPPGAP